MTETPAAASDERSVASANFVSQPAVGWSFLRSRRWIGYYALFTVFSIACVFLGNWQFDRRAEARAEIDRIDNNYDAAAVPLADELLSLDTFDEDAHKWQTVTVPGRYLDEVYLARNRPGQSAVGSNILQPLRTDTGEIFFVDRGWVDVDATSVDENIIAALPHAPSGPVTVEARLRASEQAIAGRTSSGITVPTIQLDELARIAGVSGEAFTGAYGMLVSESPSSDHGALPPKPERDEGPHLSYALQWYVFILIAAIGVIYAARQEYRGLNRGSEEVLAQDRRRAERKKRRGPSDSDEEDALLDS